MDQDKKDYNSPSEIGDHLKITYIPTYLLATAVALLIAAFIVWGILGNVSDKAYYENEPILSVTTITYPSERYMAKVSALNPVIDDNGMAHVEATLKPHPHLLPGMTAFITLIVPDSTNNIK